MSFFWGPLFWISGEEWVLPYSLVCRDECNVHSPRSTSGATCTNLLPASAQSVTSPHACAEVGFERAITRTEDESLSCILLHVPPYRSNFCPFFPRSRRHASLVQGPGAAASAVRHSEGNRDSSGGGGWGVSLFQLFLLPERLYQLY